MVTDKDTIEIAAKVKSELRFKWKTPSGALKEALRRLAKVRPADSEEEKYITQGNMPLIIKVKVAKLSIKEILDMDNLVRAEAPKSFGLRQLRNYPVVLDEYSPVTEIARWKKLLGGKIVMEPNKIPYALPVWEECEGYDAKDHLDELKAEVDTECQRLYPTTDATRDERKAVRNSLLQRRNLNLAKGPEVAEDPTYPIKKKKKDE